MRIVRTFIDFFFYLTIGYNSMMKLFNEIPQLRAQLETKGEWRKYYGSRLRFAIAAVREKHCGHDCNNCKYARRGEQA